MSDRIMGMTRSKLIAGAERMFFIGMQHGWVMGEKGGPWLDVEGWKEIVCPDGEWACIDRWGPGGGHTFIEFDCRPVWVMRRIEKPYAPEVIPLLKETLALEYRAERFLGGRGPTTRFSPAYEKRAQEIVDEINASGGRKDSSPFWNGNVYGSFDFYLNEWGGDFTYFNGREGIFTERCPHAPSERPQNRGGGPYWGGLLV
ncbi:MAG: hypothetical protein ACREGH_02980 [Minisyncoccia bacterium]